MSTDTKPGWKNLPEAGIITEAGSSVRYETGDWRTMRPIHNAETCTSCKICWIYCPDTAILIQDGKMVGFDLAHCKGCGICARECPPKIHAITMVSESEFRE